MEVLNWILEHWAFSAFMLGVIFEIPQLKLRPFTRLIRWMGNISNKDLTQKIEKLDADMAGLKTELDAVKLDNEEQMRLIDMNDANRIRTTILEFANSLKHGHSHSQEEFDHIIDQNDLYQEYIEKYKFKNGRFEQAYQYILKCYGKCLEEDSFLS